MNTTPEIQPISLASSTHGYRLHKRTVDTENIESDEERENMAPENSNIMRHTRKRSRKDHFALYYEKLYEQREKHHNENMEIKNNFLTLFQEYLKR